MDFIFVEIHVSMKLNTSVDIYFNFASLVDFLGPEISVWKFWPKIPLTLCTKRLGPVAHPIFLIFTYFAGMISLAQCKSVVSDILGEIEFCIDIKNTNKNTQFKLYTRAKIRCQKNKGILNIKWLLLQNDQNALTTLLHRADDFIIKMMGCPVEKYQFHF